MPYAAKAKAQQFTRRKPNLKRGGLRITKTASCTKMDLSVSDPVCVAVEAVDLNLR